MRCLYLVFVGLFSTLQSCNNPEVDSIQPTGPTGTPKENPIKRVVVDAKVSTVVVDKETGDSLSRVKVYYDVYRNRPFPPYMDAYLILNALPLQDYAITGSNGRFSFYFNTNVSDHGRDSLHFNVHLLGEAQGYKATSGSFDVIIPYLMKPDTVFLDEIKLVLKMNK